MLKSKILSLTLVGLMTIGATSATAFAAEIPQTKGNANGWYSMTEEEKQAYHQDTIASMTDEELALFREEKSASMTDNRKEALQEKIRAEKGVQYAGKEGNAWAAMTDEEKEIYHQEIIASMSDEELALFRAEKRDSMITGEKENFWKQKNLDFSGKKYASWASMTV